MPRRTGVTSTTNSSGPSSDRMTTLIIRQILTPLQIRTPGRDTPEHRLCVALVESAIDDLRFGDYRAADALWWLFHDTDRNFPSFAFVCDCFGIDLVAAREYLWKSGARQHRLRSRREWKLVPRRSIESIKRHRVKTAERRRAYQDQQRQEFRAHDYDQPRSEVVTTATRETNTG